MTYFCRSDRYNVYYTQIKGIESWSVTDPGIVFFTDDVKYVTRPFTALNYTLLGVGGAIILTIVLSLCAIIGIRNRDKISSLFTNEDV